VWAGGAEPRTRLQNFSADCLIDLAQDGLTLFVDLGLGGAQSIAFHKLMAPFTGGFGVLFSQNLPDVRNPFMTGSWVGGIFVLGGLDLIFLLCAKAHVED
jgi:hypothetical protein